MFCREKQSVENRAARRPIMLKLSSVTVASMTPLTMGIRERYTCVQRKREREGDGGRRGRGNVCRESDGGREEGERE